jgi:RNA polymerase sigma factor (sigma-70 family)
VGNAVDADRVRRIGDDRAALEAFYVEFYPEVVRYFAYRVQDPHDVADLVADTFLAALGAAATFDARRGRPLGWLLGIAHNTLRRFYRRRATDQRAAARFAGRRLLDDEDIAHLEERIDAGRQARAGLKCLSFADRELVELVDGAGLTPAEAARVMGLLPGTVRVRIFRARARLRASLTTQEET